MKKACSLLLVVLILSFLASCTLDLAGSSSSSAPAGSVAAPAASSQAEAEEVTEPESLRVLLPTGQTVLEDWLKKYASAQNINLTVESGGKGAQYTQTLLEQLAEETPPDLYFLEGERAARQLLAGGFLPADLQDSSSEPALAALAAMTPPATRLLDGQKVYGMPLGTYAEGTLVNLPMLASLLNTDDLAGLVRNLRDCSYNEWKVLLEAIEAFLEQPKKYGVKLNSQSYTLPRYRPDQASALRGIYANSTTNAAALLVNNLSTAYAAAFLDPADLLDTDVADVPALMEGALDALYDQLEFESQHFATEDGPLARGEAFATAPRISDSDARTMFAEGQALLWKADTREALRLEEEFPALSGKLALIPNKLPIQQEDIAQINTLYGISCGGYLCINPTTAARQPAGRLLVECFTQEEGRTVLEEELFLLPHSDLYPQNTLLAQLDDSFGLGFVYVLPLTRTDLDVPQTRMGEWVYMYLMGKAEWTDEDRASFQVAGQSVVTSYPGLGAVATEEEEAAEAA